MSKQISIQELTAADFEPFVGDCIECEFQDRQVVFKLAQVKQYEHTHQFRNPFSLVLHAEGGETLRQGTYRLSFPVLGAFELFVVPVSAGKHQISFS